MITSERIENLRMGFADHLREGVLRFWLDHGLDERGGFWERLDRRGSPLLHQSGLKRRLWRWAGEPKSLIHQSRMTWAFAAAYAFTRLPEYRAAAEHGFVFLRERMYDPDYGGWFWLVSQSGRPRVPDKHLLGQSFAMYAMTQLASILHDPRALELARHTSETIERHAHDATNLGYFQAFTQNWQPSSRDQIGMRPGQKSLNVHQHLLEAFTLLYSETKDFAVRQQLEEVLGICLNRIVDPRLGCSRARFDPDWTSLDKETSHGHNIELAHLLLRAAEVLGRPRDRRVAEVATALGRHVVRFGFDRQSGGVFDDGPLDEPAAVQPKLWWVQAEALVGFLALFRLNREPVFWTCFEETWKWVRTRQVDAEFGEWYERVGPEELTKTIRSSPWKDAYHNTRACIEVVRYLQDLATHLPTGEPLES